MKTHIEYTGNTGGARNGASGTARRGIRGLSIVEMLIALAISASVLTAVAAALDVSFRSYGVNQENANLMQRCRLAMHRITTDIRTTREHVPLNAAPLADFKAGRNTADTGILMLADNGELMGYSYDPINKLLNMTDANGNEYVVARGVEAFQIKFEPIPGASAVALMRASVMLTVRTDTATKEIAVGGQAAQTVTMSTSVMPRRNVW